MRRTQPNALTLILTGYPAFETALEAIRAQVDDYLVKPANIDQLIQVIEERLNRRPRSNRNIQPQRLAAILHQHLPSIVERWLRDVSQNSLLQSARVDERERLANLPELLSILTATLESDTGTLPPEAVESVKRYGGLRASQGHSIPMLIEEMRLLRLALNHTAQENLLALNVSMVFSEMIYLSHGLDLMMRDACEAHLAVSGRLSAASPETTPHR